MNITYKKPYATVGLPHERQLRVIVIGEESIGLDSVLNSLKLSDKPIDLVGFAHGERHAMALMASGGFDLAIISLEWQDGKAFDLLSWSPNQDFKVVFVASNDRFLRPALHAAAVDYLQYPLNPDILGQALRRVGEATSAQGTQAAQMRNARDETVCCEADRVVVKTAEAMHLVRIENVARCEAHVNYTNIVLQQGKPIFSSRTLKEYATLFHWPFFLRVHQSHLVNMHHVERFEKREGGFLMLDNGDEVPVSKSHKEAVFAWFK